VKGTMRTAIYVHAPSTVTIRPAAPGEASVLLYRYQQPTAKPGLGAHALEPGIYMAMSVGELTVTGDNLTVASLRNDKDIPPDPKAVLAFEPGATVESVNKFFQVAKDADPPDRPAPVVPVEDDAAMFDDEDDVEDD